MKLNEGSECSHTAFNFLRIAGVIGNQERGALPSFPTSTLTPLEPAAGMTFGFGWDHQIHERSESV